MERTVFLGNVLVFSNGLVLSISPCLRQWCKGGREGRERGTEQRKESVGRALVGCAPLSLPRSFPSPPLSAA